MVLKLRTALFWMHLAVGVVAGLFILNMAVSGILIAYSKQITALAERSQRIGGITLVWAGFSLACRRFLGAKKNAATSLSQPQPTPIPSL